uniref:RNA helicase n=1 Tax=Magnetococcus massalia (strain MO-1) TaxID=451514 RepID=A0A1S7LGC3_MAGMO|nr:ATP-dependent RNA helicase hrpA [Candidatus Magnetococcus massalia]
MGDANQLEQRKRELESARQQLEQQVSQTMLIQRHALKRHLRRLKGEIRSLKEGNKKVGPALGRLRKQLEESLAQSQLRQQRQPTVRYPEHLPVSARREEIAKTIGENQVTVLCGETGSGKTTQLPKICLEMGLGVHGHIGVTQPRRIAARGIADHLAEDLGSHLGDLVGYKVRFHDQVADHTLIKVMTDGILLAESQGDRFLNGYSTLIIDEAHERSLNIDFLLGFLKGLLPRRPDLKVIISSATLDTEKFAKHFDDAPIIQVSGRTYPVEMRYRPPQVPEDDESDLSSSELRNRSILHAVDELFNAMPDGDVLVFLPGEREIREATDALRKHHPPHVEITPLYARLSAAEQQRIFHPGNKRRIVLSTNVAETSLTVPRIHGVIDTGLVRISRFSPRTQVQRLPIERVSQASANQRAGRCGRLAPGICIRLYSEEDFAQRPAYTDPEVLRTSLASVILTMKNNRLGDPEDFPFIDPPKPSHIREGIRLLRELDALDRDEKLTETGRNLSRFPLDVRLARMILAAVEQQCLSEMLILAAALSTQNPREYPDANKGAAKEAHKRHSEPRSEFITLLRLWHFMQEGEKRVKSKNQFRKFLKSNFLSPLRVREWRDVHHQLQRTVKELGHRVNQQPAEFAAVHKALLAGLLGNIGFKQERNLYSGPKELQFQIFPGSDLFGNAPKWIVAAELVETTKLYGRLCARIDPEWVEEIAPHLVKKHPFDPHWEKKSGQAMVYERVTLFGLTLIPKRSVAYGPIAPEDARALFIHNALVDGNIKLHAPFHQNNRRLITEAEEMEHRTRNRGYLADDQKLFEHFDAILPKSIYSLQQLERWRRSAERKDKRILFMPRELVFEQASDLDRDEFPGHLKVRGHELPLIYQFNPGQGADGVTVTIPLPILNQMEPADFDWLVPGMLEQKITALLKILPKKLRRPLVPLPQTAAASAQELSFGEGSLTGALARHLLPTLREEIPSEAWQWENFPDHLRMNYRIVDEKSRRILEEGRDLRELQQKHAQDARAQFDALPKSKWEKQGIKQWDFDPMPLHVQLEGERGRPITTYPALTDHGDSCAIALMETEREARITHHTGLLRLIQIQLYTQVKGVQKNPPVSAHALMHFNHVEKKDLLARSMLQAAADQVFFTEQQLDPWDVRNAETFNKMLTQGRPHLIPAVEKRGKLLDEIFKLYGDLRKKLKAPRHAAHGVVCKDIAAHLEEIMGRGFLLRTPMQWLAHYPRYLKANALRWERAIHGAQRDGEKRAQLTAWEEKLAYAEKKFADQLHKPEALLRFRWILQEYRVSLFAQDLRTSLPISEKRLGNYFLEIPPR